MSNRREGTEVQEVQEERRAKIQSQGKDKKEIKRAIKGGGGGGATVRLTSWDLKSWSYLPSPCSTTMLRPPCCFNLAILTLKTFRPSESLANSISR